ncbi:MAG: helix-turn-helix transcriptional regulator [Oleispira sp.]|nr:helix-turn-helix transcriptional regulator [Oleispira sp.]MBL4881616.1 helix-turn-helix transcriptional regulator [Oleispira sp.]
MATPIVKKALLNLGSRIESIRISKGIQQSELVQEAGISKSTYLRIIAGKEGVGAGALFSIFEALDLLDGIVAAVPEQKLSPMQIVSTKGKSRKRVRASTTTNNDADKDDLEW